MTAEWPEQRRHGLAAWSLIPLAAVVWWVVGFLPWILGGLRIGEFGETRTALPLFAGNLVVLAIGSGFGALVACLLMPLAYGTRRRRAAAVFAGVMLGAGVTLVQSFATFRNPDPDNFSTADRVLIGLTAGTIAATLIGVGWGLLALTGPVGSGLTLAGAAGAFPLWSILVLTEMGLPSWGAFEQVADLTQWIGVAILAVGLLLIGIRPLGRLLWWPVAVALAWLMWPTVGALGYLQQLLRPGTVLSEMLDEQVSLAWHMWREVAALDARPLTPWIVAIAVAAVMAVSIDRWRRRAERADVDRPETQGDRVS